MSTNINKIEINQRQRLFLIFTLFVLADLTVINLFDEYASNYFHISSFTASIVMAVILQILLVITIKIEHKIADFFKGKEGVINLILRILVTWALLFGSKIIMMKIVDLILGNKIEYYGPYHGLGAFILIIIGMIIAENLLKKVFLSLKD
jgi:hypothetical protein